MVVLLLFVGLAVDFGMAYLTRAQLGKAADAAALTAARYSALPTATATGYAQSAFAMNLGSLVYTTTPTATITPTTVASGTVWNVVASGTNKTFFAGLLPGYSTLNVASSSQSLAKIVEMTLVLDISSSMISDGGKQNLPGAVQNFITYFDDNKDSVALVYFSSTATLAMPMQTGSFQSTVHGDAANLPWGGHTFSDAALQKAFTQELQPVVGNVQKVVVFFTDGGANLIQGTVTCSSGSASVKSGSNYNFGGEDPGSGQSTLPATDYDFIDPKTGGGICNYPTNCCTGTFPSASTAGSVAPAWTASGPAVTPWSTGGTPVQITWSNVRADALYRAIGDANAMRNQGITVYAIGLGSAPDPVDPQFLCQVANDPCSATYNPNLPAGVYQSAATGADLDQAFQTIASLIRLRLTQ
jgi:Flp pilus assembly protein TadG